MAQNVPTERKQIRNFFLPIRCSAGTRNAPVIKVAIPSFFVSPVQKITFVFFSRNEIELLLCSFKNISWVGQIGKMFCRSVGTFCAIKMENELGFIFLANADLPDCF
ncbi:MAG: hypothetical protein ABIP35_01150 [Ginsengibacter sp.]